MEIIVLPVPPRPVRDSGLVAAAVVGLLKLKPTAGAVAAVVAPKPENPVEAPSVGWAVAPPADVIEVPKENDGAAAVVAAALDVVGVPNENPTSGRTIITDYSMILNRKAHR